jgi:SAM-dependent methyltransferase
MSPDEYAKLDQVDREHWFYCGKRTIVQHWIDRYLSLSSSDLLVDAGCGTGTLLIEMASRCQVIGLDGYEESITRARPRVEAVGGKVLIANLEQIDLPDGCAAVVTALDVLEHLDDDVAALHEITRLLRPAGLLIVTVPALPFLWSDWDEALHHRRRYTRKQFLALIQQPGLEVLRCVYFNTVVFPFVALIRMSRKLWSPIPGRERAEDRIPSPWLNSLLFQALVKPACWQWFHPPIGVALLAVIRRVGNSL